MIYDNLNTCRYICIVWYSKLIRVDHKHMSHDNTNNFKSPKITRQCKNKNHRNNSQHASCLFCIIFFLYYFEINYFLKFSHGILFTNTLFLL